MAGISGENPKGRELESKREPIAGALLYFPRQWALDLTFLSFCSHLKAAQALLSTAGAGARLLFISFYYVFILFWSSL